eukprot:g4963.t1
MEIDEVVREDLHLMNLQSRSGRPSFHLMPPSGWINDPNGPLFHNGRFHLFYQQLTSGVAWDYGIIWGHATSTDLVHWEHLPPAIVPTPGGLDANGCFSGCCVKDVTTGLPVILYTGVRLRTNEDCGPLPPSNMDLNLEFIESQCFAIADPNCEKLTIWHKSQIPFLAHPPPNMQLTGWRDPFILFDKSETGVKEYRMLIGSGIKGVGGAVLIYKSTSLASGWTYHGLLCVGNMDQTYTMWECPILIELRSSPRHKCSGLALSKYTKPGVVSWESQSDETSSSSQESKTTVLHYKSNEESSCFFFCISPDAPNNPVLYWIGDFVDDRFIMETAEGPFRLDLGDVLYAPNLLEDDQGRHVLWGWIQELSRTGEHDYAGCLTVPRVLSLHNNNLVQEPAAEILELRIQEKCWHIQEYINLYPGQHTPLEVVGGDHLDIEISFERVESMAVGILFRSFDSGNPGQNALLLYNWQSKALEVIKGLESVTEMMIESVEKVGGLLDSRPGDPLELRILIDQSCVEIFSSSGEVLTTRMYRGDPGIRSEAGIDFLAYGGRAHLAKLSAYEMRSIWDRSKLDTSDHTPIVKAKNGSFSALETEVIDDVVLELIS